MREKALPVVQQWCIKNPGVWTISQVAEATSMNKDSTGRALLALAEYQPKIVAKLQSGVYLVRAPEFHPEQNGHTPPPPVDLLQEDPHREQPRFEEILPDDEDLFPPFKIQIYDHFRSRKGDKMYRFKDELGRRGGLWWVDDD